MTTPVLKSLQADPESVPDLTAHEPSGLTGAALAVWEHFVENTPYWWGEADVLTVERYCFLIGVDHTLRQKLAEFDSTGDFKGYQGAWLTMKSVSIELKAVEYSLGVTPQGRAALKLSHPANQGDREEPTDSGEALDPDDL